MRQFWMASLLVASAAWGQPGAGTQGQQQQQRVRVPQARHHQQQQKQQHQQQQQKQQAQSPFRAFENEGLTTFVEEVATPDSVFRDQACAEPALPSDSVGEAAVVIDQIINLGKTVWSVIEKGKPVLESKYSYANALPKGVRSAGDLEGWSALQAKSYRVHAKNGFGITVYDVTYTLVHRYGGGYQGKGRYLDNVTVLPQHVSLMWGYTMNLDVNVTSTVNMGTRAEPISGMSLELLIKVSTVIKNTEIRGLYDFHGNSPKVLAVQ